MLTGQKRDMSELKSVCMVGMTGVPANLVPANLVPPVQIC